MRPYLRSRVTRTLISTLGLPLAASAVSSCAAALGGSTAVKAKAPATLVIVQGGAQTAQAGRDLPNPIVLRVLDSAGEAVAGVTVTLAVVDGGGAVTPASDTTDSRGEFRAKWTLGAGQVIQTVMAAAAGVTPITIGAIGLLPTKVILVQGSNQSAKTGTALLNSVIVRVVGNDNVPMVGVPVGFQVVEGGGGVSPATVLTNSLGEASTKWTMGPAGSQLAWASYGSLVPVAISATSTP
jgi:hypothetical protein